MFRLYYQTTAMRIEPKTESVLRHRDAFFRTCATPATVLNRIRVVGPRPQSSISEQERELQLSLPQFKAGPRNRPATRNSRAASWGDAALRHRRPLLPRVSLTPRNSVQRTAT